jgi:hypothetical protein
MTCAATAKKGALLRTHHVACKLCTRLPRAATPVAYRFLGARLLFCMTLHYRCSLALGDMEDLQFDYQLTSAGADGGAAAGWCVRCPKHRKKFCGGLYFSVNTGHAYVKGAVPCIFARSSYIGVALESCDLNRAVAPQAPQKSSRVPGEWVRDGRQPCYACPSA